MADNCGGRFEQGGDREARDEHERGRDDRPARTVIRKGCSHLHEFFTPGRVPSSRFQIVGLAVD
jgi:hypothetical protein